MHFKKASKMIYYDPNVRNQKDQFEKIFRLILANTQYYKSSILIK